MRITENIPCQSQENLGFFSSLLSLFSPGGTKEAANQQQIQVMAAPEMGSYIVYPNIVAPGEAFKIKWSHNGYGTYITLDGVARVEGFSKRIPDQENLPPIGELTVFPHDFISVSEPTEMWIDIGMYTAPLGTPGNNSKAVFARVLLLPGYPTSPQSYTWKYYPNITSGANIQPQGPSITIPARQSVSTQSLPPPSTIQEAAIHAAISLIDTPANHLVNQIENTLAPPIFDVGFQESPQTASGGQQFLPPNTPENIQAVNASLLQHQNITPQPSFNWLTVAIPLLIAVISKE